MIGQYVQGNQPDQQAAYYYDWSGQPWKTQELTRRILRLMYGTDKFGLAFPGMDDQGSTSSWYVMSAMGFYTVDPSSPNYILGSPIFDRVTIHLGNGKDFAIAVEQALVQPRGYGAWWNSGAEHGASPEQKMGQRTECCASLDALADAQMVHKLCQFHQEMGLN